MANAAPRELNRAIAKSKKKVYNFDYTLLFLILFMLVFGLLMLYSTTAYAAALKKGAANYYLVKQLKASILGLLAMAVFSFLPYQLWKKFVWPAFFLSVVLVIYVLFAGATLNESSRWIIIGGFSFQPSEIGKVALILYMAYILDGNQKKLKDWIFCVKALAITLLIIGPVADENFTTAAIMVAIVGIMFFVGTNHVVLCLSAAGIGGLVGMLLINSVGYRAGRIDAWRNPEKYATGIGLQTLQALYAIGTGGLWGKGIGNSMQKYIVPEASNDMIFTIIVEELGLVGAVCVLLLYMLIIYRLYYIATRARDLFGTFLCIGIMVHIAVQVILNVAVVTKIIPNTGVTLPFISYGGTALAIQLGEMGLALAVSRQMEFDDE